MLGHALETDRDLPEGDRSVCERKHSQRAVLLSCAKNNRTISQLDSFREATGANDYTLTLHRQNLELAAMCDTMSTFEF